MDSIRGVLSFVRTVETGSFAAAGRALGISAVGVSKNVRRLEGGLGVQLLQRSTRNVSLTAEGRELFEQCSRPLQELQAAHRFVRESGAVASGEVRVTCVATFGRSYLAPLLPRFSRRHPRVRILLDLDDQPVDMVARQYDVGIRVGQPSGEVIAREIARLPFVICAAPSYLAERGAPRTAADLAGHNCLQLQTRRPGQFVPWPVPHQDMVKGNLVSNDLTTLVTAALHGHGLALVPLLLVLPLLRAKALVTVLPDHHLGGPSVYVYYRTRKGLAQRVRVFVDFLVESFKADPTLMADPREVLAGL
jgi:DNA-binding transcriptional LysR family regulator